MLSQVMTLLHSSTQVLHNDKFIWPLEVLLNSPPELCEEILPSPVLALSQRLSTHWNCHYSLFLPLLWGFFFNAPELWLHPLHTCQYMQPILSHTCDAHHLQSICNTIWSLYGLSSTYLLWLWTSSSMISCRDLHGCFSFFCSSLPHTSPRAGRDANYSQVLFLLMNSQESCGGCLMGCLFAFCFAAR